MPNGFFVMRESALETGSARTWLLKPGVDTAVGAVADRSRLGVVCWLLCSVGGTDAFCPTKKATTAIVATTAIKMPAYVLICIQTDSLLSYYFPLPA